MTPLRALVVVVALLVPMPSPAAAQGKPVAAPGTLKVPAWISVVTTSDGGTMVSDGAIMLDVSLAKPSTLPTRVIPSSPAIKALEQKMMGPHTATFGPLELKAGPRPGTYVAPNGLLMNTTYVDFLRDGVSLDLVRLRFGAMGPMDPITILVAGKPVGLMMPVAGPKP